MACVSCGSNEIEYADAKGETVCMSCGTVLEESSIVNAIGFDESASGAQYVWRETACSPVALTPDACSLAALLSESLYLVLQLVRMVALLAGMACLENRAR